MTREGDWVGDVGHLTLADSALSEVAGRRAEDARLRPPVSDAKGTGPRADHEASRKGRAKVPGEVPSAVPEDADVWSSEVLDVAEERNELLHAVARNRCITCGTATLFQHPRTKRLIDRNEEAVQALTEKLLDLRERGGEIAAQSRAS